MILVCAASFIVLFLAVVSVAFVAYTSEDQYLIGDRRDDTDT